MDKLGTLLLKKGIIKQGQLDYCLDLQRHNTSDKLGHLLRYHNMLDDIDIGKALAEQLSWKYFDDSYRPDAESIQKLGIDFMSRNLIFPVQNCTKTIFVLANTDDPDITDCIHQKFGNETQFMVGAECEIRDAIDTFLQEYIRGQNRTAKARRIVTETNLLDWVHDLLVRAFSMNATDIHLEPSKKGVIVRFRIDGVIHFIESLDKGLTNQLVNIIINKAGLNISDFYNFLEGVFTHKFLNKEIEVRVSNIPSVCGPSLGLRIHDKNKSAFRFTKLGYSEYHWDIILSILKKPHGIILFAGPTGCGKTTSLYSILNHLKSIDIKILTIEDPVEMRFPLITQVQVNEKRNIGFSETIRAYLRQDPDIIFIGEIRDCETAQEAFRASNTGRQIFSTLHTNDPVASIYRLKDFGVESSVIANSLLCVNSQRLVRVLCNECKKKVVVHRKEVSPLMAKYLSDDSQEVFVPCGCDHCTGGYKGRTVVSEILIIDENIKDYIHNNRINEIHKYILSNQDYLSIYDDMAVRIKRGQSSLEEAVRVLG